MWFILFPYRPDKMAIKNIKAMKAPKTARIPMRTKDVEAITSMTNAVVVSSVNELMIDREHVKHIQARRASTHVNKRKKVDNNTLSIIQLTPLYSFQ